MEATRAAAVAAEMEGPASGLSEEAETEERYHPTRAMPMRPAPHGAAAAAVVAATPVVGGEIHREEMPPLGSASEEMAVRAQRISRAAEAGVAPSEGDSS